MDNTPTYPARFKSLEEWRAYRSAVNKKYATSEKGRANMRKQNASPLAPARYARYRETEKYQEAQRRYGATAKAKATSLAYLRKLRSERPEVSAAHHAVQQAVGHGLPRPKTCSSCGLEKRLDGHHHLGYAKSHWLDVTWLCRKCHRAAH